MKKLFFILGLILILFAGCSKANDTVRIITDRDAYTPAMSSAQGIKMTPDFKSYKNYKALEYHWITEQGTFVKEPYVYINEIRNQGASVLWGAIANDKVINIDSAFKVKLEVINIDNNKILAKTELIIVPDKGFYKVKK